MLTPLSRLSHLRGEEFREELLRTLEEFHTILVGLQESTLSLYQNELQQEIASLHAIPVPGVHLDALLGTPRLA